jgi:hypothetical protein
MLKKIFACAIVLAFNLTTNAQDTTVSTAPKPTISGYVDVYYRYNLSNPKRDMGTFNNTRVLPTPIIPLNSIWLL